MMKMSLVALFATSALVHPAEHTRPQHDAAPAPVRYAVAPEGNEALDLLFAAALDAMYDVVP